MSEPEQQPHYLRQDEKVAKQAYWAQEEARERKAKRDVIFGSLWILGGVVITLMSLSSGSGITYIVWGPVVYGGYLIWRGKRNN